MISCPPKGILVECANVLRRGLFLVFECQGSVNGIELEPGTKVRPGARKLLAVTPDGDLLVFWYGGSRQGEALDGGTVVCPQVTVTVSGTDGKQTEIQLSETRLQIGAGDKVQL